MTVPPIRSRAWWTVCLLACSLTANDFYVDGRNGRDRPDYGTSASTPWRTLRYALSRISPPAQPATHTLFVAGGQVYGPATNGETYPLVAVPGVAVVGVGDRPVLDLGGQFAGIRLNPRTCYPAATGFARLAFRGGVSAFEIGGFGAGHRPSIVDCRFEQQAQAVLIAPAGYSGDVVTIGGCEFRGGAAGVSVRVWGSSTVDAVVLLDVDRCRFVDCAEAGVLVDHGHDGPQRTGVGVAVRRSRFDGCQIGVHHVSEMLGVDSRTEVAVERCSFSASGHAGIAVLSSYMGGKLDRLTVTDSSFLGTAGTAAGIQVRGCRPGNVCEVRRCVVAAAGIGLQFDGWPMLGNGIGDVSLADLDVSACGIGLLIGGSAAQFDVRLARSRLVGNGIGVRAAGGAAPQSRIELLSTIVAGSTGDGIELDTPADVRGSGLTVADNAGTGLDVVAVGAGSAFDHGVFADNGIEIAGTVAVTWSATRGQPYPGEGNRQIDPGLLRPYYKLHPSSLCIDAGSIAVSLPATDYEGDPRVAGTLPDLGADELVREGSTRPYGVGGFGADGLAPAIAAADPTARPGATLRVDLLDAVDAGGRPASGAALAVGTADTAQVELAAVGAPGSWLWTDARWLTPLMPVGSAGSVRVAIQVPRTPELFGAVVAMQWLVLDSAANPAGAVATGGLRVTLGRGP